MKDLVKKVYFKLIQRKSIITIYSIILSILIVLNLCIFISVIYENKEMKTFDYNETGKVDYKVFLKENDFFKDDYLEKNNQYISSLIKNIKADFNYELDLNENESKYKYKYKIEAETSVIEKDTKNVLYKETDNILSEKEKEFDSSNKLIINEKVNIKYTKYNDLISKFIKVYNLDNCESTLKIKMYVDILDEKYKEIHNEPVISLNIPLTTKTVAIDISSDVIEQKNSENRIQIVNKGKILIIVVLLFITVILGIKLFFYIIDTKNEKTIYKMKLRKIFLNYGSYIQKINKDFDFEGYQAIELNSFENLIRISELVKEPILMLERSEETHFMLPTENKLIYMFELNTGETKKRIAEKNDEKVNA